MKRKTTVRIYGLIILIVVFSFAAIIAKLSYVVLSKDVDGIDLTLFANSRNTVKKSLYAKRGSIYDVNGNDLATTVNSYTLIAYLAESRTTDPEEPNHVVDKELTAKKLSEVLNAPYEELLNILNKTGVYQVEFGAYGRGLTELKKRKIEKLNLPGIDFLVSSNRYYKMGDFASYLIGYAKNYDGKIKGEMGIESAFDDVLEGVDGYTEYQKDAYGYQMPNTPYNETLPEAGSDIYLTIDNNIQIITENAIRNLDKDYDFDWMTFNVMDAKTGAIVASASSPSFNLNDLNTLTSYLNPLISYQYEPGSTMKTYSFMAAMEEGIYNGSDTFKSGSIEVADATIKDFNNTGWGVINYDTGFAYSSNVAATNLALKLGRDKLTNFYKKLGFGASTDSELSGELSGQINFKYKTELANASFGQGITTTPIQNLRAMSLITNNGVEVKPYLVDKIVSNKGKTTYEAKTIKSEKLVSDDTISKMNSLLYNVVYNGLTDAWQPNNVVLAGKTGTAQIASPKGGYLSGEIDYIKSFSGYFPYDNPKYIIYVSVKRVNTKSNVLASVVTKAVEEIAKYSNLTSKTSDVDETKIVKVGKYINNDVSEVLNDLSSKKLTPIVIGNGNKVINQYPLENSVVNNLNRVFILTNDENYLLPDLTGYSVSEVINLCNLLRINYTLNGYGFVKDFSFSPGTNISTIDNLNIYLSTE